MKELIKFLKPYTKESILGPLFKLTEATFELFVPLVVAAIVTNGIEKNDNAYILKMGGLMVLLALIGLICALTAQFFAAKAATGFAASLREAIFDNIQSRTYSELEEQGTGALITRITSDVNQLQTGVNLFLRLFLRSPFIVFGAVIMAFTVNVKGALVFTICVPILFLVVFAVLIKSIPLYKKVQSSLETVTVKTRENITGIRVIRAFNCDDEESEAFDKEIDTLKSLQLLAGRVTAIMNPATFLIVNVATLAVLYVGASQVNAGIIERGALIALLNYMAQILVELIKLANLIITMIKSVACGDRISTLLKEKNTEELPLIKENKFEKIDSVEFESVGFIYPGASKESLKDISFRAKKGEIVGIIGGTGSGKTTLINLICGYYGDYSGTINVNKENLKTFAEKECGEEANASKIATVLTKALRGSVGIVPQTAVLFAGTVEDNLKWGKNDATKEDMDLSLKRAEAYDFVYSKKGELKAEVTEGGKNFSGGQRQRLSIARAFIKEPEILILDDSTSALDFVTEKKVRAGIREIAKDSICFVVSQRAASIMDADKILVLDEGELAGCGRHEELIKSCEVYREIYKSQFPEAEI
ncbi:ABC-type multidrug transport system, ATPase and permease component [Lachnospiraceae bacterium G41]|nr:ABC-type multidrug transport system, ATPase and permease component [Lachnospiraceae bacterium G41]